MRSASLFRHCRQAGGFFFFAFLLLLASCNSPGAEKTGDSTNEDSLAHSFDKKAATEKLHAYSRSKRLDLRDSFLTVIHDVIPSGNDWLVTFTDSGGRAGLRNGVALLDAQGAVKDGDLFDPAEFMPGKGPQRMPVHYFFSTVYQEPRLELSYTFYCTDMKGQLYLYDLDEKYRNDNHLDVPEKTPIGFKDLPAEYVDTIQSVEKYWLVKDGRLERQ